jgi:hypothetical protein
MCCCSRCCCCYPFLQLVYMSDLQDHISTIVED